MREDGRTQSIYVCKFKQNISRYQYQLIYESATNLFVIMRHKHVRAVYFVLINNASDRWIMMLYSNNSRIGVCQLQLSGSIPLINNICAVCMPELDLLNWNLVRHDWFRAMPLKSACLNAHSKCALIQLRPCFAQHRKLLYQRHNTNCINRCIHF